MNLFCLLTEKDSHRKLWKKVAVCSREMERERRHTVPQTSEKGP